MKTLKLPSAIAILMLLDCLVALSQPATNSPDDEATAWNQLQQAGVMPALPQAQTQEQMQQFLKQTVDAANAAAVKARAFCTQFPESTNAVQAKIFECTMLQMAFFDSVNQDTRKSAFTAMVEAQDALLSDPRLTDTQRFDLRVQYAQRIRQDPQLDWKTRDDEYEKNMRELIKGYPQSDKVYKMFIIYAAESSDKTARAIANEVLDSPASDSTKDTARGILRRLDAVDKPLDIKFTALDGREVDLSQMKGKVVLVDFWATWCGPCVGEIPHVKEAYDKLHPRGFDVIGISFDNNENALRNFVSDKNLEWPQYFDGKQWGNKFGVQYAIDSIPTMWLVDKKGVLRESNARDDLQGKAEKLLAE